MKGADHRIEKNILFGKYRIISTLGAGSSSTVYLAEHLKLKVYRAIKCIPKNTVLKASLSFEDGLPKEAGLLKNLNHPGIPLIYDIDEDHDFIYMIEEYIQGESLDTLVLHRENISQELIIEFGIQICDILDYLHHLTPNPILYQDLKPEHIILCGNQLKIVDFGIASFFTGSVNYFQNFGTYGFAPPEAFYGLPATAASDIYSLGKVLQFMAEAAVSKCSPRLMHIIQKAAEDSVSARFQSAASLKAALNSIQSPACRISSHLIRNIAVIGSRSGSGATHLAVSLVCTLNKLGILSVYHSAGPKDPLAAMAEADFSMKESGGIYCNRYFKGLPDYGEGIEHPSLSGHVTVTDYGNFLLDMAAMLEPADLVLFVMSGSSWDLKEALILSARLKILEHAIFVINFANKKAAKTCAKALDRKVYCFPADPDPFRVTAEKERLVSAILNQKGGKRHFRL